jgi:hypothetical protein
VTLAIQVIPAQLAQSVIVVNEDISVQQVLQVIPAKQVELVPRVTEVKPVILVILVIPAIPVKQAEPDVMVHVEIRVILAQ